MFKTSAHGKILACLMMTSTILAGCSMAPKFEKPAMDIPPAFKEEAGAAAAAKSSAWWQKAQSLEAEDRGSWWKMFGDETLNSLQDQAAAGNQPLKGYAARVEQARAAVRINGADVLPNIGIGANASRTQLSAAAGGGKPSTLYTTQASASYEPDFFSRVRDQERAFGFDAKAMQAAYQNIQLALQADVAQNYFLIRALDDERRLLRETVQIREKQASMLKKRYAQGDVSEQDFAHAQSDFSGASADLTSLDRQRANLEHALAVLLGKTPYEFSLPESPLAGMPPAIPGGIPSTVLERRPDIAAAIAAMEAANQRIGAAKGAFFPNLLLTATAGSGSASLGNLFQWSARTWALGQLGGLALSLPLFDNGRRSAQLDSARAAYDESIANYRQDVLVAFKEVEDGLSDQSLLYRQWIQTKEAADQASRATRLVQKRYDLGDVDYFEVVETQRTSLAAERAAVQVRGQRFIATINLIRALGGGWDDIKSDTTL